MGVLIIKAAAQCVSFAAVPFLGIEEMDQRESSGFVIWRAGFFYGVVSSYLRRV